MKQFLDIPALWRKSKIDMVRVPKCSQGKFVTAKMSYFSLLTPFWGTKTLSFARTWFDVLVLSAVWLLIVSVPPAGLDCHLHLHFAVEPWPGIGRFHCFLHAHRDLQDSAVCSCLIHTLTCTQKGRHHACVEFYETTANVTQWFLLMPREKKIQQNLVHVWIVLGWDFYWKQFVLFVFQTQILPVRKSGKHRYLQANGRLWSGTVHKTQPHDRK